MAKRNVGGVDGGRQVQVVGLQARHPRLESEAGDARTGQRGLGRAERHARAGHGHARGQVAQAGAHAAAEVDHVRHARRRACGRHQFGDPIVDEMEGLRATVDPRSPDGAMDRALAAAWP